MALERETGRRLPWRSMAVLVIVASLATSALTFNVAGSGDYVDRVAGELGLPWFDEARDTDDDGLSDRVEVQGWSIGGAGRFVTDPSRADSDGDGLTDGQEAGPLKREKQGAARYAGLSNPVKVDSDGDGVGDGVEFFADMNPMSHDTDDDGLRDDLELEYGSDPTLANPDGDSYSDRKERERGSDPLAYDLNAGQAAGAFTVGLAAGDWSWGARKFGRVNDAQLESPEYLIGQIVSGLLVVGDVRDLATNLASLDIVQAVLSAVGMAPAVGDTARTVSTMAEFAKRGDRAERAVDMVIERLPWSRAAKVDARKKVFGGAVRLPRETPGRAQRKRRLQRAGLRRNHEELRSAQGPARIARSVIHARVDPRGHPALAR